MHKDSNYNCDSSCFPFDPTAFNFDFSNKSYLTFKAKVGGTPDCAPSVSLSGGGWPRLGSNTISLEGSYVDHGYVNDEIITYLLKHHKRTFGLPTIPDRTVMFNAFYVEKLKSVYQEQTLTQSTDTLMHYQEAVFPIQVSQSREWQQMSDFQTEMSIPACLFTKHTLLG